MKERGEKRGRKKREEGKKGRRGEGRRDEEGEEGHKRIDKTRREKEINREMLKRKVFYSGNTSSYRWSHTKNDSKTQFLERISLLLIINNC